MITHVKCRSILGDTKLIPRHKLDYRPSVYAIIIHENKILLLTSRTANLLALPGGGIEIGEPLEQALIREVKEETGLIIEVDQFLTFEEEFFYYDPQDLAFHSFRFVYQCNPLTLELVSDENVADEEAEKPRWYPFNKLNHTDFQSFGHFIMNYLHFIESEER